MSPKTESIEKQSEDRRGTGISGKELEPQEARSLTDSDKDDGKILWAALKSPEYQELLERFMEIRHIDNKRAAVSGLLRTAEKVRERNFYLFTNPLRLSYSRVVHRLMLNPNGDPDSIVEAMLYQ